MRTAISYETSKSNRDSRFANLWLPSPLTATLICPLVTNLSSFSSVIFVSAKFKFHARLLMFPFPSNPLWHLNISTSIMSSCSLLLCCVAWALSAFRKSKSGPFFFCADRTWGKQRSNEVDKFVVCLNQSNMLLTTWHTSALEHVSFEERWLPVDWIDLCAFYVTWSAEGDESALAFIM